MVRVLFAGSPSAAAETVKILLENSTFSDNEKNQKNCGFKIVGVLTNPPTAKGRHKELIPTPVEQETRRFCKENFNDENLIPVFCPEHLDLDAREKIQSLQADILVCFAYGHIFGPKFLSLFKFGGINLHPSALPKYRGATPIPECILNCDAQTAFSVQTLSLKMDEGDILAQEKVLLTGKETTGSLLQECAISGAQLIIDILKSIEKNGVLPKGVAQKGEASYTKIILKEYGKIDFNNSAKKIDAQIRAYTPEPGCFCYQSISNKPDETLRIIEAHILEVEKYCDKTFLDAQNGTVLEFDKQSGIWIKTSDGILCVTKIQRQGKNVMTYKDFMNGAKNFVGSLLK